MYVVAYVMVANNSNVPLFQRGQSEDVRCLPTVVSLRAVDMHDIVMLLIAVYLFQTISNKSTLKSAFECLR